MEISTTIFASYVDDLCIIAREPMTIINDLENVYKHKLKGTGKITYHLGCDYFSDSDGTLAYAPRTCIEKLIDDYVMMFGHKSK